MGHESGGSSGGGSGTKDNISSEKGVRAILHDITVHDLNFFVFSVRENHKQFDVCSLRLLKPLSAIKTP